MEPLLVKLLSEHKYRITMPRRRVFNALKNSHKPLSIVELATILSATVDTVSVYRTIDLFIKLGIVTAITHGWKQRYELAAPFLPHHHHLVCRKCEIAIEVNSRRIEELIASIASEQSFVASDHVLEINGLCYNCNTRTL